MTVLAPAHVERFLSSLPEDVRGLLFHGPDRGLVSERARRVVEQFLGSAIADPFSLVKLFAEDLVGGKGETLSDALSTPSFSCGRKCVWVQPEGQDLTKLLSESMDQMDPQTLLVVEAAELRPTSALRKWFEKHPELRSIGCYHDGQKELGTLIDSMLREQHLDIDREARTFLLGRLGGDRLASRMELEKLCLYVYGKERIGLEDVLAVSGDVSGLAMEEMVDAVALGDPATFDSLISRLLEGKTTHGSVIKAALHHFCLLHGLRCAADQGEDLGLLVKRRKPPIFFKRHEAILRQCRMWNRSALEKALHRLQAGEVLSRTAGEPLACDAVYRTLLNLAVFAKESLRKRAF